MSTACCQSSFNKKCVFKTVQEMCCVVHACMNESGFHSIYSFIPAVCCDHCQSLGNHSKRNTAMLKLVVLHSRFYLVAGGNFHHNLAAIWLCAYGTGVVICVVIHSKIFSCCCCCCLHSAGVNCTAASCIPNCKSHFSLCCV